MPARRCARGRPRPASTRRGRSRPRGRSPRGGGGHPDRGARARRRGRTGGSGRRRRRTRSPIPRSRGGRTREKPFKSGAGERAGWECRLDSRNWESPEAGASVGARHAVRASSSSRRGGSAPGRDTVIAAASAERRRRASSSSGRMPPPVCPKPGARRASEKAVDQGAHEGVAGTDRVDDLGRHGGNHDLGIGCHGDRPVGAARDHDQSRTPDHPLTRDLDRVPTGVQPPDVFITRLDDIGDADERSHSGADRVAGRGPATGGCSGRT